MQIWIVEGSSGEYSDHREWPLKAFRDEKAAQRLVIEAQARANEIQALRDSDYETWWTLDETEPKPPRVVNEFDPRMELNYTGVHYTCYPIELVEEDSATRSPEPPKGE